MSRATPATILNALNWRYAVKQFDPTRKIDAAVWADLEKSLALTPSSFGLQPWQFLIVDNPDIRAQLVPHSWHQRQVADASHLVIMAVRTSIDHAYINSYLDDVAATRQTNRDALAGFEKMLTGAASMLTPEWAARQAYIALGQFMLAAAMLDIDTCPMEGFSAPDYDRILGLADHGLTTAVLCPAGYRAPTDSYAAAPKVRWPVSDVVKHI
jgi:nitroreductase